MNAKNYTLNDSFSGFSAGSAMGMGDIERMLNMIPGVS
nr:MAG TPA: signaling protein [Caudoviricetes sp.]